MVEAGLDHEQGVMMSSEVTDVYGTAEPMRAFDERIKFCLNLRNESVKVSWRIFCSWAVTHVAYITGYAVP